VRCTLDRVEEGIAVLIPLDTPRQRITVPLALLPAGCGEGDILNLAFEKDPAATAAAKERVAGVIEIMKKSDR
jgi:hypothetical protein